MLFSRTLDGCIAALVLAVCLSTSAASAGVMYRLDPYSGFTPTAVNNHGQVVGTGKPNGWATAYVWSAQTGRQTINAGSGYLGYANDINDQGMVCGVRQWSAGYLGLPDAFLYNTVSGEYEAILDAQMSHANALTDGATPTIGGTYTYTNYSGNIRYYKASIYHPTGPGTFTATHLGSAHHVAALNNRGEAVGHVGSRAGDAFFYDGENYYPLPGLTEGRSEGVADINDAGLIVGQATNTDNHGRAVMWQGASAPTDLGVLTNTHPTPGSQHSAAMGINRWGEAAGWSTVWLDGVCCRQQRAVVFRDGQVLDLNDLLVEPAATISWAYAINDAGQIATERGLLTPEFVANGGFNNQSMDGWSKSTTTGTVIVTEDPDDATNNVLAMTTGSPVAATQVVDTPDQPFTIAFDYRFASLAGEMSILLGETDLLPHVTAGDISWHHVERLVTDESLFGRTDINLTFALGSETGDATVYLDNITLSPSAVPEPGAIALVLAGVTLVRRRR